MCGISLPRGYFTNRSTHGVDKPINILGNTYRLCCDPIEHEEKKLITSKHLSNKELISHKCAMQKDLCTTGNL